MFTGRGTRRPSLERYGKDGKQQMHTAVILRLVPDIAEELEIDSAGTDIDREWIGIKLNEFDEHALEEAILLKESVGAHVTAAM